MACVRSKDNAPEMFVHWLIFSVGSVPLTRAGFAWETGPVFSAHAARLSSFMDLSGSAIKTAPMRRSLMENLGLLLLAIASRVLLSINEE